jgi:hypothetical protein
MQTKRSRPRIDSATLRRLAVTADVDPRTLLIVHAGAPPINLARQRAAAVLRAAGLLVPKTPSKRGV